ncbi:MAG: cob(I)yrinic acid a,c-diamide adenosyltransferase [Eggerthella lenta]
MNKFRGDVEILRPGLAPLEKMCGVPVVGVVPYLTLDLDDEDSLAPRLTAREARGVIDVAVVRLPHLSNFTDFDPLSRVPGMGVRYVSSTTDLGRPDLVVLPGSKSTVDDARWLAASGIGACVRALSGAGTPVLGICGGYQLLGDELSDPHGREGAGTARGLGLISASTVFKEEKRLAQSELRITGAQGAFSVWNGMTARGYEIHDGETTVSCALRARLAANQKARPAETCSEPISTACSTNRGGTRPRALARAHARPAREYRGCCGRGFRGRSPCARVRPPGRLRARGARHGVCLPHYRGGRMIHVYHGDGKGKTTAAMGLALRMLAAGRRVVVVQFLKDGESGEVRLLAEHFGVPVFAGKASDKFTWSMTSEELAATRELHDGNLASALAELEGAQEGLLVLDEALDALSKGLVDEALVDRALDMSAAASK